MRRIQESKDKSNVAQFEVEVGEFFHRLDTQLTQDKIDLGNDTLIIGLSIVVIAVGSTSVLLIKLPVVPIYFYFAFSVIFIVSYYLRSDVSSELLPFSILSYFEP